MTLPVMSLTTSTGVAWNGPICPTCTERYLGAHACSVEDIDRRIGELAALRERLFDERCAAGRPARLNVDIREEEDVD